LKLFSNPRFLKTLAIGVVVTGILTWLATSPLFVQPLYRAEALIYVPLTIPSRQTEQQGIGFASDIEIDGHIQIFQSGRLRDSLINRFNLAEKYAVDLNKTGGLSNLYDKINSRIKFEKTRYSSVSVSVMNPDPVEAAEMANGIVKLGDEIKEEILYENRRTVFMQAELHYENKASDVRNLESRIDSVENLIAEREPGRLESNLLFKLKNQYSFELHEMLSRQNHLESVEHDFKTELPKSYIISKAIPPSSPSWPPRKLITAAAVAAYIFLLIVVEIVKQDVKSGR
jgi:uncharacterized protein involved in exopolysaccharide biosynthesis